MKNKTFLVTGGAGGIGSAIVETISRNIESGTIIIHYNSNRANAEKLQKRLQSEKVKVELVQADLESKAEVEKLCDIILTKHKGIYALVNNAGYVEDKELQERTYEDFEKAFRINLFAPFVLSKKLGKAMFENKSGKIINISSASGLILHGGEFAPTSIDYDATKAAMNSLTKNFAKEYAPYVNVNAIAAGWVDTPFNIDLPDFVRKEESAKILKQRWAKPQEIADFAWFLMTDKADFINGSIHVIDGGKK